MEFLKYFGKGSNSDRDLVASVPRMSKETAKRLIQTKIEERCARDTHTHMIIVQPNL